MAERIRAAIYTRVSTEEQTQGYSLEAQESLTREYAKNKNYEIYAVYVDEGFSGKDFDRPQFQQLLLDLNKDKFDVILVWKVDRLSRNNTDVLLLIDKYLTPRNKKLIITTIDRDSSDREGYMFISLLSTFARYERATIIDRVNAGMQKRAEKGLWNGGTILGYDSVEKELVINEKESKVVREIFELRADGKGYKAITNLLNARGCKTKKGKRFSIPGIKLILNNHIYIGKMVWRTHQDWSTKRRTGKTEPILVDGVHEAIIDDELWSKVQEVNEFQKKSFSSNRNFNGNFFLTGILKCPKCGAGTVMSKSKKKNSDDYHLYYMCQGYHSKGKSECGTNLIKKEEIEQKVLNEISILVNNKWLLEELINEINTDNDKVNKVLLSKIDVYKKQLRKVFESRSKLDSDYFDNVIESSTYSRLINKLDIDIEQLENSIRIAESEITWNDTSINKDDLINTLRNFNKFFNIVNDEEKKLLIRTLIKEIHVEVNRKDIKEITFWFSSDNVLPSNKVSSTVS